MARYARSTYFRSHEFWSPAERACRRTIVHVFLAQPVIGNFDVSVQGQKDIVELQISVDYAVLMEVLERKANLSSIESMSP